MFRSDGPGRDQHNVGPGPNNGEQRLIGRAAESTGQASERGGAVDAGDHVEPHGRARARTRQFHVQRGWIHGIAGKRPKLAHRHTPGLPVTRGTGPDDAWSGDGVPALRHRSVTNAGAGWPGSFPLPVL
jgi:hypothetical protein